MDTMQIRNCKQENRRQDAVNIVTHRRPSGVTSLFSHLQHIT